MSSTPYDPENQEFSNMAHEVAKDLLYPSLFGVSRDDLEFISTNLDTGEIGALLDGQMGIDRYVKVSVPDFPLPLEFTVQERFRKPNFASFRDITITEWNHNSNLPSELYKLNAVIFLYGYYNPSQKKFVEAIAVDVIALRLLIASDRIAYTRETNSRSNQTFLCFSFDDLIESGCVLYHWGVDDKQMPLIGVS